MTSRTEASLTLHGDDQIMERRAGASLTLFLVKLEIYNLYPDQCQSLVIVEEIRTAHD